MQLTDLTIEVRDHDFNRVGQLTPADLVGSTFVSRFNNVGSWEVRVANDSAMGELLRTPGYGIIVTGPNGVLISGPTTGAVLEQSVSNPLGDWKITGTDDSIILTERLAYPLPSESDVTKQTVAHDDRTGSAEYVLKQYVDVNIGPSATAARKIPNLIIQTDADQGETVAGQARFITLQELFYPLAQTGGIGYTVEQSGTNLEFQVYVPQDKTATVRMDLDNNQLTKTEYAYLSPKSTRVIVAGAGEAEDRLFYEATNTEAQTAETLWGRRIETFTDARGSDLQSQLIQIGSEVLVDNGKTIVNTSVTPADETTMRYGINWNLGDTITVVINDIEYAAVVTEVGISIQADGVRIQATVGTPTALSFESKLIARSNEQDVRISNLERNTTGYGVTTPYQPVWSGTGLTYTGTPVTGHYTRFGNLVHFRIMVTCTTVTNFGTGQYHLTLPYAPVADYIFRDGGLHEIGNHYAFSGDAEGGSIDLALYYPAKGTGNQVQDSPFTATAPKTLATTDYFYICGTYEIEG